jgi:hypothetical protein
MADTTNRKPYSPRASSVEKSSLEWISEYGTILENQFTQSVSHIDRAYDDILGSFSSTKASFFNGYQSDTGRINDASENNRNSQSGQAVIDDMNKNI